MDEIYNFGFHVLLIWKHVSVKALSGENEKVYDCVYNTKLVWLILYQQK